MMTTRTNLLLATLLASAPAVQAAPMPDAIAAMLDAAAADAAQLKIVADIAKKTNPQSATEIDAKVAGLAAAQAQAREEKLASQGFFRAGAARAKPAALSRAAIPAPRESPSVPI